jgi:hypothetical protein
MSARGWEKKKLKKIALAKIFLWVEEKNTFLKKLVRGLALAFFKSVFILCGGCLLSVMLQGL